VRISWTMIPVSWPKSPMVIMNQDGTSATSLVSGESGASSSSTASFTVLNTDPFTSLLSIARVAEWHAGTYICNASSTVGHNLWARRSHRLTVLGTGINSGPFVMLLPVESLIKMRSFPFFIFLQNSFCVLPVLTAVRNFFFCNFVSFFIRVLIRSFF
jgi:hypothetical protein